jgi:hypothetical protein
MFFLTNIVFRLTNIYLPLIVMLDIQVLYPILNTLGENIVT